MDWVDYIYLGVCVRVLDKYRQICHEFGREQGVTHMERAEGKKGKGKMM